MMNVSVYNACALVSSSSPSVRKPIEKIDFNLPTGNHGAWNEVLTYAGSHSVTSI